MIKRLRIANDGGIARRVIRAFSTLRNKAVSTPEKKHDSIPL